MTSKSEIRLTSKFSPEFSSNITVDNITYHVQTEDMGTKTSRIISNVYLKGEIVFTKKTDYSHMTNLKNFSEKLASLMERQHKSVIDQFTEEKTVKQKLKPEYFAEVQQLLRRGNGKIALNTLREAIEKFPADPYLLSYYGCLIAVIENRTKEGVRICESAIKLLKTSMPFGSEFFYPVFYLNLGRAYLKDKKKRAAVQAFQEGLKNDPENRDLLWEMKKIGIREKPPLPFLTRNNPINKYIGILLYNPSKK
jgi:tetratricopeptide (TPR) repeat protein